MSRLEKAIEIVRYRDEFAPAFDRLNRTWLERFHLLEPEDLHYLEHPRETIVDQGGEIFVALAGDEVVGTCAVIPLAPGVFELAKLTVAEAARGRGLGRRLTETAIDFARAGGAERIVLSSNHQLREAVQLYERLGFRHGPQTAGETYASADIFMELDLSKPSA